MAYKGVRVIRCWKKDNDSIEGWGENDEKTGDIEHRSRDVPDFLRILTTSIVSPPDSSSHSASP